MQKAAASAESAWALRAQRVTSRVDEVRRLKDQAGKSSRGRQSGLNTPVEPARCSTTAKSISARSSLTPPSPAARGLSLLWSFLFASFQPGRVHVHHLCTRECATVDGHVWVCALLSILLPASCVLEANVGSLVHARFAGFVTDVRRPNRSYCQRQHVLPRVAPKFWGR